MKHRFVSLAMAVGLLFSLAACASGKQGRQPDVHSQSGRTGGARGQLDGTQDEMVDILALLAEEIIHHRLSARADEGRLVVFNLAQFDYNTIAPVVPLLMERYDVRPDYCIVVTSESGFDRVDEALARETVGEAANGEYSPLSEWTNYNFSILDGSVASGAITMEIGVVFPYGYLVGGGTAFVLEKRDTGWEVADSYMTWIS